MGELREVHIRISQACCKKLESIAKEDEVSLSTVCRHALWQYARTRRPDGSGPEFPQPTRETVQP